MQEPETKKTSGRTRQLQVWRLLVVFTVLVHLFPIRTGSIRLGLIASSALAWGGVPLLFRNRALFTGWAIVTATLAAAILGPARPANSTDLRNEYVESLKRYEGCRYIWGGESSRGIDCSGLVRTGLIDADFRLGIKRLNPGLVREGLSLWWFDCSADALKQEYRSNSQTLFETESLNDADYSRILPGDFAVSKSGLHTLAYIGNRTWIEADPNPMRVITVRIPSSDIWFSQPMTLMRWRQLSALR